MASHLACTGNVSLEVVGTSKSDVPDIYYGRSCTWGTVATGCPGRCRGDISDRARNLGRHDVLRYRAKVTYLLDRNMRLGAGDPDTTYSGKAVSPSLGSDHPCQSDEVHWRRRSAADESCSERGNQTKSLEHVRDGATVQCQRWSLIQTLSCTSKHKREAEGSGRGTTHVKTGEPLLQARYVP